MKLHVVDAGVPEQEVAPDWPALRARAAATVEALRPHLERPSRADDAVRRLRSYCRTFASYMENRRRVRAGREDLLPLYFQTLLQRYAGARTVAEHSGSG